MNSYDIIIIGAGAAGLFCAIHTQKKAGKVLLLEKNSRPGKKLLLSGSGRCNLSHTGQISEFLNRYGEHRNFVKPALFHFTNDMLCNFLHQNGVQTVTQENGKIFPFSQNSADVLSVLEFAAKTAGAEILLTNSVTDLTKDDLGFTVRTAKNLFHAKKIVLATGGKSFPQTGSSGDGYIFAQNLGHSIVPLRPVLTPVTIDDYLFSNCAGISLTNALFEIFRLNKKIRSCQGDIIFTHKGLSGPGILDNSRFIQPDDELRISLLSDNYLLTKEDQDKDLQNIIQSTLKRSLLGALSIYKIPDRLLSRILEIIKMDPSRNPKTLNKLERIRLVQSLRALPFKVNNLGGFNQAMATGGGINLSEVDKQTMESRIVKNLYLVGEILDIDGDTGGYNLQFAFSSGALAGNAIVADKIE